MPEAEVVLGHGFSEQIKAFYECDGKLYANLIELVDAINQDDDCWLSSNASQRKRNKILCQGLNYGDELSRRIQGDLNSIKGEICSLLNQRKKACLGITKAGQWLSQAISSAPRVDRPPSNFALPPEAAGPSRRGGIRAKDAGQLQPSVSIIVVCFLNFVQAYDQK